MPLWLRFLLSWTRPHRVVLSTERACKPAAARTVVACGDSDKFATVLNVSSKMMEICCLNENVKMESADRLNQQEFSWPERCGCSKQEHDTCNIVQQCI